MLLISILCLTGFIVCLKIFKLKVDDTSDSFKILDSKYSKIFGIGLEVYGLAYYVSLPIVKALPFFTANLQTNWFPFLPWAMSLGGFLFSLYLICIQAFVIKSWCKWCLRSATISILIFLASSIELFVKF